MQIALPEKFLRDNPRLPRMASRAKLDALYEAYGTRRVIFKAVAESRLALSNVYDGLMEVDRLNQFLAIRFLDEHGALNYVTRAVEDRPAEAFRPDYYDLAFLYSSVRALRPRRVVELGSGLSTVVMLKALQDNGSGQLQVYEFSEKWLESSRLNVMKMFGEGSTSSWISMSPYRENVSDEADIVYLDGAPAKSEFMGAELLHAISGGVVLVDGRVPALTYIEKNLSPKRTFCVEIELVESVDSLAPILVSPLMNACFYF